MPLTIENVTFVDEEEIWITWPHRNEAMLYAKQQTVFYAPENAISAVIR